MTRSSRPLALAVALLAASVALAGCGRKNDPEVPKLTDPTAKPGPSPVGVPFGPTPSAPRAETPNKPFLLDFLL